MQVLDLITEALFTTNIIGAGNATPTDQQASQVFQCLLGQIDTANAEPLRQLTTSRTLFTLRPPQQDYTVGPDPSLDINAAWPEKILRANVMDMSSFPNPSHTPVRVLNWPEYEAWQVRNSPTPLPDALWYERVYLPIAAPTSPTPPPANAPAPGYGIIHIAGVPSAANQIEFWARQPLTQLSSYFDTLTFPPGYYEWLLYGACMRIYPRFGRTPDTTVAALYLEAVRIVETANATPAPVMRCDSGLPSAGGGWWDGRTNTYVGGN